MAAKQETILVVEDDPEQCFALVDLLRREGYRVATASNGQEALDLLRSELFPCLVLLDLQMPVMDGWEFREQQKQDPMLATIPVVVMTGEHNTVQNAHSLDADAYFTQPYKISELLATVARYCR